MNERASAATPRMRPHIGSPPGGVARRSGLVSLGSIVSAMLAILVGCSVDSRGTGGDPAASSVGRLSRLIERYRSDHRGQWPQSEQDLRRFASSIAPADLASLGVTSVEGCFTSDRDGRALGLTFGRREAPSGDAGVVCYERQGKGGLRLVGTIGGNVEIADAARFAELVPNP